MALDLAINTELRRIPDPESDDIATVRRALELYDEAVLASSSVDGDMGLPVDTSRVHGATLVRVAEAAVDYGENEDALRAIDAFFREDPPRNQFFIRALFVKGVLRGREAVTLNGLARLVAVREAIAFVLQGLSICEENADPAYNFLIYNASVHHWAVARPLLREGSKREAIASFVRITDALTKVDDSDVRWRARNLLALSTCHAEAGDLDKATTIATQAQDILLQRLGASAAGAPGSPDYALIEEAYRLRIHYATLAEPEKAFDGGGKASAAASAAFSAISTAAAAGSTVKPQPDARAQVLTQLQAILTAAAPAQGATGYSHSIGRGKSSLLQHASGIEGSIAAVTQSPMNPDGLRSKLLDMLKLIRPAAHAEYVWRKAESDLGTIKMFTPDFARDQKEKELAAAAKSAPAAAAPAPAKGAPAATPVAGSPPNSSALLKDQLKKEILKKGKDLDVIALIAHAAVHCGLFDVAYSAIKTVRADKTSSPASQILSDIVDAQLLVFTTSIQDAHQLLGHFVEIPVDIINTLAIVEQGEQESKGGKDGMPKTRTRRQSLAQAMSIGFVPKRNSIGDALMLPGGHIYGSAESPIPSLTPEMMLKISHFRREAAMKPLKRCLATCRSLGDAFLAELASTVTWNIALPLLTAESRAIAFPALQEAAETLHHLDSPLMRLRVRLHLECARAAYKADLLASSADHVSKALALDYGGLRYDNHYSVSAERDTLHGSIGASGDDLRKKRERAGSASLRRLLFKAPEDPRELSSQRPLDRQLIQLGRESIVAATVYDDPSDPLDQAFVSLQQANAASEPALTATLLAKAAAQLDSAQNTPREAAAAWRRMRSPSFAIATSETSAVIAPVAEDASDAVQRASTAAASMPSSKPGTAAASKPGTAAASKPGTAKSGGLSGAESERESHGEILPIVHAATPAAAVAALAAGSTLALTNAISAELLSGGSARRKQAHRMWMKIAESAAKVKQWDLVLRATHEIRSYSWDPMESREMVLLQVRADLLIVDASAAKARNYSEIGMDEKVNQSSLRSVRLAVKRVSAAVGRFYDSSAAVSVEASAKKGAVSTSSSKEMEGNKDVMETSDLYWWEQGDFFHKGQVLIEEIYRKIKNGPVGKPEHHRTHHSSLKAPSDALTNESSPDDDDELLEKIEIPSVDSNGYFMSPQDRYSGPENNFDAVLEGPSMVVDPAWAKKHAGIPKIFVSSEVGYAPGFKPILNDARTLGMIIPGCPITLSAWKLRLISALGRSMRRGVSVRAAWVVETSAARLWNFHLHVWRQNIYGPAVFPQLLDVMRDSLECLKLVGASNYRLVAKIAHAYARSQEEAMRAALVDRQLQESHSFPKHETRINAYEGICGAVLYDYRKIHKKPEVNEVVVSGVQGAIAARDAAGSKPGTAASNSTIGSKELAHPVEPVRASLELAKAPLNDGDPEIIRHILTQTLPESPAVCKAKAESAIALALSLPTSALPVTARRDLFAIRARMKIYEMAGHGISEFLVPLSLGDAAKAAAAAASPVSAGSSSDLVTAVSKCVTSSDPSHSSHDGGCPEFAKAVCLLQIPMHCNVPFNEKVMALREAINATEKASAELSAIVEAARAQVLLVGSGGNRPSQPAPAAAAAGKTAPAAGKSASTAGSVQTQAQGGSSEWGEGDPTIASVHSVSGIQQVGFQNAMGTTATAAALDARAEEVSRDVTAALSELWARCSSTAVELAKYSQRVLIDAKLAQDALEASIPKKSGVPAGKGKEKGGADTAVSAAAGAAIALAPVKLNEPDLSLLVDAQRCAASSIRLSPVHSLRIDELGSLFGLRGHDYSDYKLSLGAEHAKTVKRTAEVVDVHIGRVNFTHRFYSGPDGTTVDGATVGGKTNCIKWWSVAELAWGSAVLMLVNPDRQSAIEQDQLRRVALDHLGHSAEWAVKVRDSSLVSTAAFLIWNICIQVNHSSATRTCVIPSATRILSAMREIAKAPGHGLTHDACILRAELYRLLLQSLSDVKLWAEGLSLAEEAFSNLPAMYHDRLWIHRLIFNSKLGQDVTHLLTSVSTKSPLLQARLWCTLARLAALPADQGAAYVAALEKLQGMFARTFVLIDYAEWLHSARLPVEDARDALHAAADNLITVFDRSTKVNDEEVDAKSSVYGSSAHMGSVEGSGSDLGSIQRSHVTRGASTFKARSSIAASEALPSMANSSAVQNTAKVGAGSTVSAFRVAAEPQDWPERGDASHFDALIRVFSLLALMAESFGERARFLLLAAHHTRSLWEMSARSANSAAAERALFKMRSSERNQIADLTKWVEDAVENGKHQIPHEWHDWAAWWPKVCLHLAAAEEAQNTGSDLRSSTTVDESAADASDDHVPATASLHASAAQSKAGSVAASKLPSAAGSQAASRAASRPGSRPSSAGKKDKVGADAPGTVAHPVEEMELTEEQVAKLAEEEAKAAAVTFVELREAMRRYPLPHQMFGATKFSIKKPALTLHTLLWLVDQLVDSGYVTHATPVLAMIYTISSDILDPVIARDTFSASVLARCSVWLDATNQRFPAAALFSRLAASRPDPFSLNQSSHFPHGLGALSLTDSDRSALEGDVLLMELDSRNREKGLGGMSSKEIAKGHLNVGAGMVSALAEKKLLAALRGSSHGPAGLVTLHRRVIDKAEVHLAWAELANFAVSVGMTRGARQLLLETIRHSSSFNDWATLSSVRIAEARISEVEGDGKEAVDVLLSAIQGESDSDMVGHSDAKTWFSIVSLLAKVLVDNRLYTDARKVLEASLHAFDGAAHPGTIDVPDLSLAQLDRLGSTDRFFKDDAGKAAEGKKSETFRRTKKRSDVVAMPLAADRPTAVTSVDPDLDALAAAIRTRLLLAEVYTIEATRGRKVGSAWVSDWKTADKLFADAGSLCRREDSNPLEDGAGGLLPRALLAHAQAILALPGADPDLFPAISNDSAFSSVAEGSVELETKFRAASLPRRARLLYIALACKLLHDANASCTKWEAATGVRGVPPTWSTPASRLSNRIRTALVNADLLCAEEELAAALASERFLYSSVSSDPISLYIFQAEREAASSGAVQLSQATPQRALLAADAALSAISNTHPGLRTAYARAVVAYGCALRGVLIASAASMQFTSAPKGSSESLLSLCGTVELQKYIWKMFKPTAPKKSDIAEPEPVDEDHTGEEGAAASRPGTVSSSKGGDKGSKPAAKDAPKGDAKGGSKPSNKGGKPGTAPSSDDKSRKEHDSHNQDGYRSEFMPLPFEDTSSVTAARKVLGSAEDEEECAASFIPGQVLPDVGLESDVVPPNVKDLYRQALKQLQLGVITAAVAGEWSSVAAASSNLVELYGTLSPVRAAASLALLQSINASKDLKAVFVRASGLASRQVLHMRIVEQTADSSAVDGLYGSGTPLSRSARLHPSASSAVYGSAKSYLKSSSLAYRMMQPATRGLDEVLALLPHSTRVLIIEPSPSGRSIYAAVAVRLPSGYIVKGAVAAKPAALSVSRPVTAQAKKTHEDATAAFEKAEADKKVTSAVDALGISANINKMDLSDSQLSVLADLIREASTIRTDLALNVRQFTQDIGAMADISPDALHEVEVREKEKKIVHDSGTVFTAAGASSVDRCEATVSKLVSSFRSFFDPLLGPQSSLAPWLAGQTGVVLCISKSLTHLPFESLESIADARSVTRDFSVSVLGHRLAASALMADPHIPPTKPPHSVDVHSWFSHAPPETCHASNSSIRFVVDPRNEDPKESSISAIVSNDNGENAHAPPQERTKKRRTLLESIDVLLKGPNASRHHEAEHQVDDSSKKHPPASKGSKPGTASSVTKPVIVEAETVAHEPKAPEQSAILLDLLDRPTELTQTNEEGVVATDGLCRSWSGLRGDSSIPSPAAWQALIRSSPVKPDGSGGGMVYIGHGRLFSYLPPEAVAGLLAPGCRFAFLADSVSNNQQANQQALLDNAKKQDDGRLELEDTWETAALLSLTGVGVVITQQWPQSYSALEALVLETVSQAVIHRVPLAQAVRSVWRRPKRGAEAAAAAAKEAVKEARAAHETAVHAVRDALAAKEAAPPPQEGEKTEVILACDHAISTELETAANLERAIRIADMPIPEESLPVKSRVRYATLVYGVPQLKIIS